MKGYKNVPTTYTIGLLEAITDETVKEKAVKNFDEKYAVNNENAYGGAATISRALEYAFCWENSSEGEEYWKKVYEEYKSKKL